MKEKIVLCVFIILIMFFPFYLGYTVGKIHTKALNNEYYNHVEALLDSIYEWNESFMNDFVQETDTYYEYELSRDKYIK